MVWLSESLKQEVRVVFEPRYLRKLNNSEVETIAENLTEILEPTIKYKWKEYENIIRS
jgi:hypothetical protein